MHRAEWVVEGEGGGGRGAMGEGRILRGEWDCRIVGQRA